MLKVFSIEEIVDATNSILEGENELSKNDQKKIEKDEIIETKIIENNVEEPKPLLLNDEWVEKKIDQKEKIKKVETKVTSRNNNLLSLTEQKEKKNNQKIIDEIYKIINKKVRKSTIKVILDQQTEINDLKEKISGLRKIEYKRSCNDPPPAPTANPLAPLFLPLINDPSGNSVLLTALLITKRVNV